jgi:hypothetical protein
MSFFDTKGYEQHGGLTYQFDKRKRRVRSIESSQSIGGVKYEFGVHLNWLTRQELHFLFPKTVKAALENIPND